MKSLKLNSLHFDEIGFRKLSDIEIPISDRITIVAGHNGIGKSTILGLAANCSSDKQHISYFDKSFRSEFQDLFYLDIEHDLQDVEEKGNIYIRYKIIHDDNDDSEIFTKKCNVSSNSRLNKETGEKVPTRPRIIPRSMDRDRSRELGFSLDGKMPLPTIYLGMSRMTPIGEIEDEAIEKKELRTIPEEDKKYIEASFKAVIDYSKNENKDCIVSHNFKGTNKRAKIPNTEHSTLAISLGQDSLSSIITALASFKKIQREMGKDYIGGILFIDEVEAGLHPRAQIKLMDLLKKEANALKLQIIMTSHSLTIIKYVMDLKKPLQQVTLDSVVYLTDTRMPKLLIDQTYSKIKHDMLLVNDSDWNTANTAPLVKIYFEDDEAKFFFEKILEFKNLTNGEMSFGANIETISLKVGSEILIKLAPTDSYFNSSVLIADNDVASRGNNRKIIDQFKNFCVLPQSKFITPNSKSKDRNPESLIYDFIQRRFDNHKEYKEFWKNSDTYTSDYVHDHILTQKESSREDRVKMKAWFNKCLKYFNEQKVLEQWCTENIEQVNLFISEFTVAVDEAVKNLGVAKRR